MTPRSRRYARSREAQFHCDALPLAGCSDAARGDELGRTPDGQQQCAIVEDNQLTWFDWQNVDTALLEFTRRLIALRKNHPSFTRRGWFQGQPLHGAGIEDIAWLTPGGTPMTDEDWSAGFAKSLMVFLNGSAIAGRGPRGERIVDESFVLLFNAHADPVDFLLDGKAEIGRGASVSDTSTTQPPTNSRVEAGKQITVRAAR